MKLKKKVKVTILVIFILLLVGVCAFFGNNMFSSNKKEVKEVKVLKKIDKYGYELKDNKTKEYKRLFEELSEILNSDDVDEEEYVSKISELFIYDFYSLKDKVAKTDIGGVDFVLEKVKENFSLNAQDTYYKYVESNIYGDRVQKLPEVKDTTIEEVTKKTYAIKDGSTDDEAYYVKVRWTYTDNAFIDYQDNATLVFVHNGVRLDLVELQ